MRRINCRGIHLVWPDAKRSSDRKGSPIADQILAAAMWSAGGFEVKKSGCGRFEAILVEHREEENVILAIALLHGLIGELYETHWVVVVNSIEEGRAVEKELNTFLDSGFVSGSRIARKSV